MTDQHGFGNHAAESAWSCQSNHNAQQMSEDEGVAHSGDGIKASKPPNCANFCNSPQTRQTATAGPDAADPSYRRRGSGSVPGLMSVTDCVSPASAACPLIGRSNRIGG